MIREYPRKSAVGRLLFALECCDGEPMTRTERWAAIIFFGVALFSAEAAVRAASPPTIACVRNGMVGLLKSGTPHIRRISGTVAATLFQKESAK